MKLVHKIFVRGYIELQTGMMIGGAGSALEIGGLDKQIVRHPVSKLPYIPGSSLKGKLRSLFELKQGTIDINRDSSGNAKGAGPCQDPDKKAARFFGHINKNAKKVQQPSRIIVRDGYLQNPKEFTGLELLYAEVKAENSIDRITSEANPRFFERVPKGAKFALDIVINQFDGDQDNFLDLAFEAFRLLEDDYLGAAGSRGNGQVKIFIESITQKGDDYYREGKSEYITKVEVPNEFKPKN